MGHILLVQIDELQLDVEYKKDTLFWVECSYLNYFMIFIILLKLSIKKIN